MRKKDEPLDLEDLLANSQKDCFELSDKDRQWLNSTVGLERLEPYQGNDTVKEKLSKNNFDES